MMYPKFNLLTVVWSHHTKKDINKIRRKKESSTQDSPQSKRFIIQGKTGKVRAAILRRTETDGMIALFKAVMGVDTNDRENVFVWDAREVREHGRKIKML